jgi:hypothetical protein
MASVESQLCWDLMESESVPIHTFLLQPPAASLQATTLPQPCLNPLQQ